ncbi:hypothetical protein RGUI_2167 [Rhodovulum sp. P5]|nr:hypothetical protein RGUI_2167 [Rhodovulum sp. P5]
MMLSGCLAAGPEASAGLGGLAFSRAAPQKVQVADDTVVIAGPRGFCVDVRATRDGQQGAFVLMASCAALTGRENAPMPADPAILTASVASRPGTGGREEDRAIRLAQFFTSEAGLAALARDGRADSVVVHRMYERDRLFLIHLTDSSENAGEGLSTTYWRALFEVNDRLVTASVVGFEDRAIDDKTSRAVLRDFAAHIRAESKTLAPAHSVEDPAPEQLVMKKEP